MEGSGALGRLAMLGPYNQDWGLTRYVNRFLRYFAEGQILILGEEGQNRDLFSGSSQAAFRAVWKRTSTDYSKLDAVLREEAIDVLHINCTFPFFDTPAFISLLRAHKRTGLKIVSHVHDSNALDAMRDVLHDLSDSIIVDSPSLGLQVTTLGIDASRIQTVESGVEKVYDRNPKLGRESLGIGRDEKVILAFDLGLPEARLEELIRAVYQLQGTKEEIHLYVLQVATFVDVEGGYGEAVRKKVEQLHLDNYVHFIEDLPQEPRIRTYIESADAVVLSSSRPEFEAREVLGLCLQCGTPIVTMTELPFENLAGAVFPVSKRFPLGKALAAVLSSKQLATELEAESTAWAASRDARAAMERFSSVYSELAGKQFALRTNVRTEEDFQAESKSSQAPAFLRNKLRILMQNRNNALTHRGGDTVVMERLTEGLRALGHEVEIDVDYAKNPKNYDLVHLYNFAIREVTEKLAKNAHASGTPYVVTTMYEDWPKFYNQMANVFFALHAYVEYGQPQEKWQALIDAAKQVEPSPAWDNSWAANHSAALIATGVYEAESLKRDYPAAPRVEIYHCGSEVAEFDDGGSLFRKETGLEDFVLCVGRLEWRKNQLMLLKALEDSELPVVFLTGGFTYQPDYEAACRKFKRKGKTLYFGRMEPKLLASAFSQARTHVLPSWFELPGLVSLEAARYGTNVVVTDYGTARDYFGDEAYYCKPDDAESIQNAVLAAYYSPTKKNLKEKVQEFTWDQAVLRNLEIYQNVLDGDTKAVSEFTREQQQAEPLAAIAHSLQVESVKAKESVQRIPEIVLDEASSEELGQAEAMCVNGDKLLREGNTVAARTEYQNALIKAPKFARAHRSLGVIELQQSNLANAAASFRTALRCAPRDTKSLLGLGAVEWEQGNRDEAFEMYTRAQESDPNDVASILYLVNAGYALNRLSELELALRRFLRTNRDNLSVQYCLAGCYYRQDKKGLALGVLEHILQVDATHADALELKNQIASEDDGSRSQLSTQQPTPRVSLKDAVETLRYPKGNPEPEVPVLGRPSIQKLEELKRQKEYRQVVEAAAELLAADSLSGYERSLVKILRAESFACSLLTDDAEREFADFDETDVLYYRVLCGRGALLASRERWAEACASFSAALKKKPNCDIALAGLGICAIAEQRGDDAWGFFRQAQQINPENVQAIHGLIQLGYALGRLSEIEPVLIEYLDLRPVDLPIVYSLAGCLYAQGKFNEAEDQLRKILLFEPENDLANELMLKIDDQREGSILSGA